MNTMSALVGFLVGAAAIGGAWFVTGTGGQDTPSLDDDPLGVPGLAVTDHPSGAGTDARLARIERRLDELVRTLGVRRAEGPELAVRGTADPGVRGEPGGGPAAQPVITDEVLEKTLERMQDKKYAKWKPAQLRAEAHRLIKQAKDMNGARDVLERLLGRDLEPDYRAQVLTDLGSVHRETSDFAASEKALRDAMRTAGMDSETGVKAGYHLVWTFSRAKQPGRALAMADELIKNRDAPKHFRPWLRWAGARMAFESGDQQRAQQDYRALLDDVKDDPQYRQIVRDAAVKLKEMESGPR